MEALNQNETIFEPSETSRHIIDITLCIVGYNAFACSQQQGSYKAKVDAEDNVWFLQDDFVHEEDIR